MDSPGGSSSPRKDYDLDFPWTPKGLKGWCLRTVRPSVRWRRTYPLCWLWLATSLLLVTQFPVARSDILVSSSRETSSQTLNDNPNLVQYWNPLERYLTKYGYLHQQGPSSGGNLRTESQLRESIKTMQVFGNIPPSGKIDADTIALLRRRRCGMPDIIGGTHSSEMVRRKRRKRFAIQGQKWHHTNLTWSIRDWPPNVDPSMVRQELSKAFKVWSDASKLDFEETRSSKADIVVSFLRGDHNDGYPFDGRGIVLAHAFFPGEGIGGDAHFDVEEPWVETEPQGHDGVSLFAVAAHEFGHSLGLSHSSVSGSLMNPFYQTIKDNFQLPRDDTFGIQTLYGPRNPTRWEPISPYNPPIPTTMRPRHGPGVPTSRTYYPRTTTVRPRHHAPKIPTKSPTVPHTCNTTFDALSVIRRELFIFKGKYFWRLNNLGLMKNYPVEIHRFWYDNDLNHVDAAYERPIDTKIVFFSGKQFWLFNGNIKERGYPRPLTDLGLPEDLPKIEAAMVWGYNGKTYLFSGTQYWRYDEADGRVELDYPRDMSMWRGVPYGIDAAFKYLDGQTYFFKGRKFWRFNDRLMRVHDEKPGNINQKWFGCPNVTERLPASRPRPTSDASDTDEYDQYDDYENNDSCLLTPKASTVMTTWILSNAFVFYLLFS